MAYKNIALIFVALCFYTSCNDDSLEQRQSEINALKSDVQKLEAELAELKKSYEFLKSNNEELTYRLQVANSMNSKQAVESAPSGKILPVFRVHGNELSDDDLIADWIGLFANGAVNYALLTDVKFKKVRDPLLDEKGDSTALLPVISSEDTCLFLFSGLDLADKNVVNIPTNRPKIYPEDTLKFYLNDRRYFLLAASDQSKPSLNPRNYELYLEFEGKRQLLTEVEAFDDTMVQLLWAGDLDNDGFLDLILDTSNHYNVTELSLYLSSYASEDKLVAKSAIRRLTGC